MSEKKTPNILSTANLVQCMKEFLQIPKNQRCLHDLYKIQHEFISTNANLFLVLSEQSVNVTLKNNLEQIYIQLCEKLYSIGSVPQFKGREDIGYTEGDFKGVSEKGEVCMAILCVIIGKWRECDVVKFRTEAYIEKVCVTLCLKGLLLSTEHSSSNLWTTTSSLQVAKNLKKEILDLCRCESVEQILHNIPKESILKKGLLSQIITEIQCKFDRGGLNQNPSLVYVFSWCLQSTPFPYMSDNITTFLPGALQLVDSHHLEYKLAGVNCLQHILNTCSRSELTWYGRGDVMYDALQHQMYTHEVALLDIVLPCLLSVMTLTDVVLITDGAPTDKSRFDEILQRLLSDMELENKLALRRVYAKHLPSYIKVMGINIVRHLNCLLSVIAMYLEVYDGPHEAARLYILGILEITIKQAWPRMNAHRKEVMKILLKFVCDISMDESIIQEDVKDKLYDKAVACMVCLNWTSGGEVRSYLSSNQDVFFINNACRKFILRVLEESSTIKDSQN